MNISNKCKHRISLTLFLSLSQLYIYIYALVCAVYPIWCFSHFLEIFFPFFVLLLLLLAGARLFLFICLMLLSVTFYVLFSSSFSLSVIFTCVYFYVHVFLPVFPLFFYKKSLQNGNILGGFHSRLIVYISSLFFCPFPSKRIKRQKAHHNTFSFSSNITLCTENENKYT